MINLARSNNPSPEEIKRVSQACREELESTGIDVEEYPGYQSGEVPSKVYGILHHWAFRRAWYYWIAEGPGIPPDDAEKLHQRYGQVVRVEGHCGCPSPSEWRKGFAIGLYHVDSLEGLRALADLIKLIVDRNKTIHEAYEQVSDDSRNLSPILDIPLC